MFGIKSDTKRRWRGYDLRMNGQQLIREARRRANATLRDLAARAGTSHATLAAYESGRIAPGTGVIERVAAAAGFRVDVVLTPLPPDFASRGEELVAVLRLAAQFPAEHSATITYPPFPRTRPAASPS